jgi:hypothetical protein
LRSVDWIFMVGSLAGRWLGDYITLDKTFDSLVFKQELVHISCLIAFLEVAFVKNTIIILRSI